MSKVTDCGNVSQAIPPIVQEYTNKTIPTDITDDEIDLWLAIIPDLISFWEGEVAEKKKELEFAQHHCETAMAIAFRETPEKYSVKMKEMTASLNPSVKEWTEKIITLKYELKLTETLFGKVEHISKSIHKIASLRARRLELGVVAPSIRGNPAARKNPVARPYKDTINQELRLEDRKEIYDDEF
jgi:hypothetical protein